MLLLLFGAENSTVSDSGVCWKPSKGGICSSPVPKLLDFPILVLSSGERRVQWVLSVGVGDAGHNQEEAVDSSSSNFSHNHTIVYHPTFCVYVVPKR